MLKEIGPTDEDSMPPALVIVLNWVEELPSPRSLHCHCHLAATALLRQQPYSLLPLPPPCKGWQWQHGWQAEHIDQLWRTSDPSQDRLSRTRKKLLKICESSSCVRVARGTPRTMPA